MESILKTSGISPPPMVAALQYSAKVRTEAVMRLGFYRALKNVKTLFKKKSEPKGKQKLKALDTAAKRIKSDTEKSVVFNLKDYRENLKFNYLFRLVETSAATYADTILSRFQAHFSDLTSICNSLNNTQSDKEDTRSQLKEMQATSQSLTDKILGLRNEISDSY